MNGVRRTGVNGVSVAPFGRLSAAIEALVRVTSAWHIACPHLETGLFERAHFLGRGGAAASPLPAFRRLLLSPPYD